MISIHKFPVNPALLQTDSQLWEQLAQAGVKEAILWTLSVLLVVAIALLAFVIYKLRSVPTQETLQKELQNFRKELNDDLDVLRDDVKVQLSSKLPVLFDPRGDEKDEA